MLILDYLLCARLNKPAKKQSTFTRSAILGITALALFPLLAFSQTLSDDAFNIQYGAGGITSLRRANDKYDTEYLSPGGTLGNIVIQYRTSPTSPWTAAREVGPDNMAPAGGSTVNYSIGMLLPTLPQLSSVTASANGTNAASLSDGQFPPLAGAGGRAGRGARGGGNRGRGGRGGGAPVMSPAFTWPGEHGTTQWVQYTFPKEEEISTTQVYWETDETTNAATVRVPASWHLQYQQGSSWADVKATTSYGVAPGAFNRVEFAPVKTTALRLEVTLAPDASVGINEWRVGPERVVGAPKDLTADESFKLNGDVLEWTMKISNQTAQSLEIGDLALPMNMAEGTPQGRNEIYTQKLIRHSSIGGNGSWVYWQRANADGPFLVMVPQGKTKIEYAGAVAGAPANVIQGQAGAGQIAGGARAGFTPFIHAAVSSVRPIAQGKEAGRAEPWLLPISSLTLAPKGSTGDSVTYTFHFAWAKDFNDVREVLYREGSIDVNVVPGLTLPIDQPALFSLRTKNKINSVDPEFSDKTQVKFVADKGDGIKVYQAKFSKLGENKLTVKYGDGQWSAIQFFITEPLETVIKKRSAFLVNSMQHNDSTKPWYGSYGDWDQEHKILRDPENRDRLSPWLTDSSDDAGNARPAYVASKNLFFPNQSEIDSVERYIKFYLFNGHRWDEGTGGMQMTEKEPYPYGIYGTFDNWWQHRAASNAPPATYEATNANRQRDWTRLHQEHLWRIYDYPHIMLMYFRMYQIAKEYPTMVHYANADEYLMLAYHTSVAYWVVPTKIENWRADEVPTMNEAFLPELISALDREGKKTESEKLAGLWNAKVEHYVNTRTRPNLFGSEFAFDSTGYESTGSMAHYAVDHASQSGSLYTPAQAKEFLEFQLRLNIGDRGNLENTYFELGSDYRGGLNYLLSYMSQMGGWGVLDYGLYFAKDPATYLRLGYASSLSSWALVNSGTAESGYGYWWPGKENDGATGGGFNPEPMGSGWIGKAVPRGAWYYSAEEDVGYCGALRTHATIITKDPIFGEYAYGGELTRKGDTISVIPRDGLRARIHIIRDDQRLHLELIGAAYASEQPVAINDKLSNIQFTLENPAKAAHKVQVCLNGLPAGEYKVNVDNQSQTIKLPGDAADHWLELPLGATATAKVTIQKAS
jgi:Family of unknown function (DUF5695)